MKRHGDLWGEIVDIENIELAFNNARKGKSWQRQVKEVMADKENKLNELQQMLLNKTYKVSPYKVRTIYEPKQRDIYIVPFYPDRVVHHALINVLAPIWDKLFIFNSFSCRKGKGQHKGSIWCERYVKRNGYVLQCDVSKFYPSVNHDILMEIIKQKIKDEDTLWLVEEIVRSFPGNKNVPIGNYTSQWLGNIYLNELDMYIKHELRVKDYLRYCDDFLLFDNDKQRLREISQKIKKFCKDRLALKLSRIRLFPTSKGVDFLGYQHKKEGYMLLRKSTKKRFKKRINRLRWELKNGLVELDKARSTVDSIYGWMKHANTYNLRNRLGLDRIRGYIMKGLPKYLNTKEDYLFLKDNYNKSYWEQAFQNLLDTRYDWFPIEEKDYVEDNLHKKVVDEQEDRVDYFVFKENENASIYRLGFTVNEIEDILAG